MRWPTLSLTFTVAGMFMAFGFIISINDFALGLFFFTLGVVLYITGYRAR